MKNVDFALAGYSWPRMGSNHVIPFAALSTAMLAHRSGRYQFKLRLIPNTVRAAGFEPASSPTIQV